MKRGVWTRRWLAASGGVLVNGLILGALVLIEEPPPLLEELPVIVLDLERPQRQRPASKRASIASGAPAATARASPDQPAVSGSPAEAEATQTEPSTPVDPRWRMERKTLDSWRLTEGVPAWNWGRYYRACKGLSSEHMTDEEKDRCYGGWNDRRDKRPSPNFIGPIDERKWEVPEPKPPPPPDEPRRQRCRDYRGSRTPGFSERNMPTGSPPPSLRERGCF